MSTVSSFQYGARIQEIPSPNRKLALSEKLSIRTWNAEKATGIIIRDIPYKEDEDNMRCDFVYLATDDVMPQQYSRTGSEPDPIPNALVGMDNSLLFSTPGNTLKYGVLNVIPYAEGVNVILTTWKDSKKQLLVISAHGGGNPWHIGDKTGNHSASIPEIIQVSTGLNPEDIANKYCSIVIIACNGEMLDLDPSISITSGVPVYATMGISALTQKGNNPRHFQAAYPDGTLKSTWDPTPAFVFA